MANEGELPGADLKTPSLDFELPGPSTLDLPGPTGNLDLPELKLDAPLEMPPPAPEPKPAVKSAVKPAAKPPGKKKPGAKPPKPKAKMAAPKLPKLPGLPQIPPAARLPVLLNVINIILLLAIAAVMCLFGVPVNAVPDLTLTAYVQGLWLVVGCFVVVALLNNVRTALVFTGIDLVMLATIFPTLWLLLGTPMSPMYFFVLGLIVLVTFVALPQNVVRSQKPVIKKAAPAKAGAPAPAPAPEPTGPRTTY